MTRVVFPGGFGPMQGDDLAPFDVPPPPGTRIVLMAFGGRLDGLPLPPMGPGSEAAGARIVRGEILRDPPGRLYELCGRELRPLSRLVQGPRGEILEVQPPRPRVAPRVPRPAEDVVDVEPVTVGTGAIDAQTTDPTNTVAPSAAFRKIFPDPGAHCVVPVGAFRPLLTPQISHPERLRDSHRVACHLQVYESTATQPFDAVVKAVRAEAGDAADVRLLTDEAVERLGLVELRRPRGNDARTRRRPGELRVRDRVFVLRLASDPTALSRPQGAGVRTAGPQEPATAPSPSRATSIPERYLAPWEFPLSREEVLYEMEAEPFAWRLGGVLRQVWTHIVKRRDLSKWRTRLAGKPLDEQLWSVRPPKGVLNLPAVREWAKERLDAAGYDSVAMTREWEIYWRRKGA